MFICSLVDDVLENLSFGDTEMLKKTLESFPKDITLGQTVATWKHIVQYQERLRKEGHFIEKTSA